MLTQMRCPAVAGWGMLIDNNATLGFDGFAYIARDPTTEYGSCAITSDGGYLYKSPT